MTAPQAAPELSTASRHEAGGGIGDAITGVVMLVALGLKWLEENHEIPDAKLDHWRNFAEQFVDSVEAIGDSEEEAFRLIDAALDSLAARAAPGLAPTDGEASKT